MENKGCAACKERSRVHTMRFCIRSERSSGASGSTLRFRGLGPLEAGAAASIPSAAGVSGALMLPPCISSLSCMRMSGRQALSHQHAFFAVKQALTEASRHSHC